MSLIHDRFNASFRDYPCFAHFFESEKFAFFFALYAPHFAKTALSDAEMVHEVCLTNSYFKKGNMEGSENIRKYDFP